MMCSIHPVGDPETESEATAIRYLSKALPSEEYHIIHNFELCNKAGEIPYEYDILVVGKYAAYHVEVKHFTGVIRGDRHKWRFQSGHNFPSPIPLANKKSKILANKLRKAGSKLGNVFVDTVILITDPRASIRIRDDQSDRVIQIESDYAIRRLTDPARLPHFCRNKGSILPLHDDIVKAVIGSNTTAPSRKTKEIGLYDVNCEIAQYETHRVYLASHRYISTRPKTILKVFNFDLYANEEEREKNLRAIFHDQEALRMLSAHPNIIRTGDFFAHESNQFVLPHEYFEHGRTLEDLLENSKSAPLTWQDKRFIVESLANGLKHCHKAGIVHRDVKPHSIVVVPPGDGHAVPNCSKNDGEEEEECLLVKLVNFDLARIRSGPSNTVLTDAKERLDAAYTAPEVWKDPLCASEASDVFSLGVTFYELITNHKPFESIENVIKSRRPVPIDIPMLVAELSEPGRRSFYGKPEHIVSTIQQMLEVDPKQRHQSMDQVIAELNLFCEEENGGLRRSERISSMRHLTQICIAPEGNTQ